jgi:hypothetical protein
MNHIIIQLKCVKPVFQFFMVLYMAYYRFLPRICMLLLTYSLSYYLILYPFAWSAKSDFAGIIADAIKSDLCIKTDGGAITAACNNVWELPKHYTIV